MEKITKRRVLILEDVVSSRKALVQMIRECRPELLVYEFSDSAKAFACAMKNNIDIFLVDIVLKPLEPNDFSGITFAKKIRECSGYASAEIIFITGLAGLEGYLLKMVHCFDYIEKPITEKRVQGVIRDALRRMEGKDTGDELVFFRRDGVTYPLYTNKIIYAESRGKILYVYTSQDVVDVPNLSLKRFLEKVNTQPFASPAKGIAVNVNYIEYIDTTNRYVKMRGLDTLIDVGARMKERFLRELYIYGVNKKKN